MRRLSTITLSGTLSGMFWAFALLGCDGSTPGDCETDLDCVDGFDCTTDVCALGNVCRNTPVDSACAAGEACVPMMGCVAAACTDNAGCDDSVACTSDVCAVGGTCMNTPIDSMCAAGERCDATMGCVTDAGCDSAADCDDSIACTADACGADRSCQHTPVNEMCNTAAMEMCVPGVGCQVVIPCTTDAECQDGDFCNGREICNTEFGCEPAAMPPACDDAVDCTVDRCDPTAPGMDGQTGACVFECDSTRLDCGCGPTGPSCAGTFAVTPAVSDNCIGGQVVYDISQLTFANTPLGLVITPRSSHFGDLTDAASPWCPDFVATATVPGMVPENYTLQGMFTDEDHFVATWTTNLPGGVPGLLDCTTGGSRMVTGTRM